jgi:type I restriction enzyme, S subunit
VSTAVQVKKLGEVCSFAKVQGLHGSLPYVGLEHIESNTAKLAAPPSATAVKSATFRFNSKHLLYGRLRPYLNKVLAPSFDGHCSTEIFPIEPKPTVLREYLLYWFLSDETADRINATCRGSRMPRADMNDVLDFDIRVPTMAEQRRIVRILDRAFKTIDHAIGLCSKNREQSQNAFYAVREEIVACKGSSTVFLGDLAEVSSGGTPQSTEARYWDGSIPWYSSGELNSMFTKPPQRLITPLGLENSNAKLFPRGSLLIGMYDTAALKMSILDRDAAFNQAIAGVQPNSSVHLPFVMHVIAARRPQLLQQRRGVRQKNLSLQKIKSIPIPVLPLEEQKEVAHRLLEAQSRTTRLEEVFGLKLDALGAFKKSLLHQAFTGLL